MSSTMRSDCRKFAPNIFNKSKCTNCFRQKEEHSAEALESNRSTRKVAKCGYLFVAPGWDFSNPLNRTKRWQRRWFVLYDDGELSYSVDEHPDTVPQASIDMNKVVEVGDAEEVTGNAYSISITTPERVHFVKGTCREECRWWTDVLSVFPRSKGRHKRNATFPGGQSISLIQQPSSLRVTPPSAPRPRFNSCHSEPPRKSSPSWAQEDDVPTRDAVVETHIIPEKAPSPPKPSYRDQPASSASPPTRDKVHSEDKARTRRVANRERRGVKTVRSFSEDFTGMLPSWRSSTSPESSDTPRTIFDDYDESKREEKLKDIAETLTRPRYRRNPQTRSGAYTSLVKPTRDGDSEEKGFRRPASPAIIRGIDHVDSSEKPVRGDPDGCGLDISTHRYSPSSELRVDLPAEELLNIKKGWLMKQGPNQEWVKHWFVLRGPALMYYRDPTSEDKGILDGVIDLSGVSSVTEVLVARNYGFQTLLWDDRRYVLSAVTAGIRTNWMSAIRRAAGLKEPTKSDTPTGIGEKIERDMDCSSLSPSVSCSEPSIVPSTPLTPRSILFSSDEEYRTASEGGRRESQDWGEALTPLPPSPPLNRTPISRVKEKARSRSNSRSRVYKRSKSSPPSSRRSTLDSNIPDDLILTSCGELPESDLDDSIGVDSSKSSLLTVEGHQTEVEELKHQLTVALRDANKSEQELMKLRQRRAEVNALEKRIKELLDTLDKTEALLTQKTKEMEEVDALRKRYNDLRHEHESVLAQFRQQAMEGDWKELYKQIQDRYRQDSEMWQRKLGSTESSLQETTERYEIMMSELAAERETVEHLHCEVISLRERLSRGIEENDNLYRRIQELEGRGSRNSLALSRERARSVDSLSDLTNIDLDLNFNDMDKERVMEEYEDLRGRFEKAVQEIRAMKRELRESHMLYDDLELSCIALRQDAQTQDQNNAAQTALMVARIDDLTLKLSAAEKQVRTLKQKMTKSDSREKRRSLSLKGRESFQICKELEEKLAELEAKISALEGGTTVQPISKSPRVSRSESPQTVEKDKKSKESKVSSRLRRKSLDSATSSEPMKVLIRLSALESKVASAAEKAKKECTIEQGKATKSLRSRTTQFQPVEVNIDRASEERDTSDSDTTSVQCIVSQLESLLSAKLTELSNKKKLLQESGLLNDDARMRLLAEKLAYESVLVARISQAIELREENCDSFKKYLIDTEVLESSRLMNVLKTKLTNGDPVSSEPCETSIDHLTRILSDRIRIQKQLAFTVTTDSPSNESYCSKINNEQLVILLQKQNDLSTYIKEYTGMKLEQLAQALAVETLSLTSDNEQSNSSGDSNKASSTLEDQRIREAWTMAQKTVNRELIQAEISHVIMRCGQAYEGSLANEQKAWFSLLGAQRNMLEQWADTVEQNLQREMESGIEALTSRYEYWLEIIKTQKCGPLIHSEEDAKESRKLLLEFADITAHKALIDARIAVICQETSPHGVHATGTTKPNDFSEFSVSELVNNDRAISRLSSDNIDHSTPADFQFLFEEYCRKCHYEIVQDFNHRVCSESSNESVQLRQIWTALYQVEDELKSLKGYVCEEFSIECEDMGWLADVNDDLSAEALCSRCNALSQQIANITLSMSHTLKCHHCIQLQEQIERLSVEHEEELYQLRQNQEQEVLRVRAEQEAQRMELTSRHQEEQAQLLERTRRLERRLGTLDSEYTQQVDNLRAAYHKTLSAGLERDVQGEENLRHRYQAEIEQLRTLCEKGLAAMENSHRRIIGELEEKHRQELDRARLEKEQALAEETQATLAALDAMRKAHETEVQREISKFKVEFVKRMQSTHDIGALHKEQEVEMEEIKKEILSLSEKYSKKCVESSSLEEQLGLANKQLADAQQHILQLDSRNKQLRAHLVSEAGGLETADAAQLLRQKNRELEQKCEEIGQLQKKLSAVTSHGDELSALCSRLRDEYWCTDRCCADNPVLLAKLWDKMQQLATSWPQHSKGSKGSTSYRPKSDSSTKDRSFKSRQFKEPPALDNAELTWSPKRTSSRSVSPYLWAAPLRSPSPSPLSGMVAERKKIFEP